MAQRTVPAVFAVAMLGVALCGCDPTALSESEKETVRSLSLDALPPIPDDPSNRHADEPLAAAFGASLFFDTKLSGGGEVACVTCHDIETQFQDGLPRGSAIGTTDRRTMPLAGVAWNRWYFWDGRRDSLWSQALTPLEDAREHGGTRLGYARTIARHYRDRYERIFGPLPPLDDLPESAGPRGTDAERAAWQGLDEERQDDINRVFANIGKALAAFQRSIRHEPTRFDRFAAGIEAGREPEGDAVLSELEIEGLKLFVGKGSCIDCHNGPRFTDEHFHNTGVPTAKGLPPDRGRAVGVVEAVGDPFNCLGRYSDAEPEECKELRFAVEDSADIVAAFKTPSLRGAASRQPYMHAGQFASLEEVVDHYARAPGALVGNSELRSFVLTDRGRDALVAFLKTLDVEERPASDQTNGP